jgi:prepilin-type N-terminal cleavage/methylation domain-containing protein
MSAAKSSRKAPALRGFTLVELVVVVAIIAIVAAIAVSKVSGSVETARKTAAEREMRVIADAICGEGGYIADFRGIPGFSPSLMRMANLLISTNVYGCANSAAWPGGARVDDVHRAGCAAPAAFTRWDDDAERGWRGPYLRIPTGTFPTRGDTRRDGDATFAERGFFPSVAGLRLPADVLTGRDGCSPYGFPGEPAVIDPWGNPYVIQIPPPQAFRDVDGANTNLPEEVRFRYARIVSAGPDGILQTPCFASNGTNWWATAWNEETRRLRRQAGLVNGDDRSARGDDMVCFLMRNDTDEGEEADL